MSSRKRLVVNADDFGFTPDINEGIVEAHLRGILTSTSLMANGPAFEDATRRALDVPSLDIGCHLVLVGGTSLVTGKPLPETVAGLLNAMAWRRIRVYDEMRAQVERIVEAGLRPTHLDSHKHTHLAPPVLEAVARVSEASGIRWVRRPFDFPIRDGWQDGMPLAKRLTSGVLGLLRRRFHRVMERRHCRTTDHFAGFQITGTLQTRGLMKLLGLIPIGLTELMCHPGKCGPDLRHAHTRLKESREGELQALTATEVRVQVQRVGIELVNYSQL